jgi:hypothetical protein
MHVAITMDRGADFEFGRMAGQFLQLSMRQAREDILFPVPKNMIGSWNGVPGRAFIKGDHNKPPLEIQVLLPCQAEPEEQTRALEDLVIDVLKPAAMANPAWARLNDPPEEIAPPPPPIEAPRPAPVVAAPVAAVAPAAGGTPAAPRKPGADAWNDLFSVDEEDRAVVGGSEAAEGEGEAVPAKPKVENPWNDLFSVDEEDRAVVYIEEADQPGYQAEAEKFNYSKEAEKQAASFAGNGSGSASNGNGPNGTNPAPPKVVKSATAEVWDDLFNIDEPAAYVSDDADKQKKGNLG